MARAALPSSDDESESDPLPPPKPKPKRRSADDVSSNEITVSRTRQPDARRPSAKVATTDKENLLAAEASLAAANKKILKLRKKVGATAPPLEDNNGGDSGPESEDDAEPINASFVSSITPLGRLPVPVARTAPLLPRKTKKATSTETPVISSRAFKNLPEHTQDQDAPGDDLIEDDAADDDLLDFDNNDRAPSSPSPPQVPSPQGQTEATGEKRRRRDSGMSSLPPTKRSKSKGKESKFREDFVLVAGAKPKAGDYEPVVEALLLRAMAEYSTRITKHGSHIRGKVVDGFRPLFATHFGFQRSNSKTIIAENKTRYEAIINKASYHYKKTTARTGYGENSIFVTARQHSIYKDKNSLAAIFRSQFDPHPAPYLALEFTILQHLTGEWSTGSYLPTPFAEKDVVQSYRIHLTDIEKWINCNPVVTEKLRKKWFKRAAQNFGPVEPKEDTHLDEEDQDALRMELDGRTGDTDSENEDAAEAM
ncbi:hypothetical protein B0H16DRAFT_1799442 [Mycena metata]|uniref:DUF6532 domain-containing protein n=1 Tax=Mycena metata TaxID=1033252 RepID=A0AAD7HCI2_9AGAR|nr:hypothetical protein B0H16DRAFT_1799442 [Mycena metata]